MHEVVERLNKLNGATLFEVVTDSFWLKLKGRTEEGFLADRFRYRGKQIPWHEQEGKVGFSDVSFGKEPEVFFDLEEQWFPAIKLRLDEIVNKDVEFCANYNPNLPGNWPVGLDLRDTT